MIRVETDGSFWFFDEGRKTYVRTPKEEAPRDDTWGHWEHEALKDLVPHPYVDYVVADRFLLILTRTGDPPGWVYAPIDLSGSSVLETGKTSIVLSAASAFADVREAMRDLIARNAWVRGPVRPGR